MRTLAAAVVLALVLGACAKSAQCTLPPTATTPGPAFLWRVTRPGGGAALWLYGTIHNAGLEAVPAVALDRLDHAARLVTELGVEPADPDLFRDYALVRKGPGIDQRLVSDDWYDLRDTLRDVIKESELRRAAPWYAMSLLSTHLAPAPGPAMDTLVAKRAQKRAMPVEALETWETQLAMLSKAVGIEDLQEAIRARGTMRCDLARMVSAYEAGDTATMTTMFVTPRNAETMLYARNRAWLPQLETYVDNGGAFVAVGLGHLLGDQGLPALLAAKGYVVERTGVSAQLQLTVRSSDNKL